MANSWTNEDIEAILLQLDKQMLPFQKYQFTDLEKGLKLLGKGTSAYVYEATARKKKQKYAIKVIGFRDNYFNSDAFRQSVKMQKKLAFGEENIVKLYDAIELLVEIEGDHTVTGAQVIKENDTYIQRENDLHLQFIVMERLEPVLTKRNFEYRLEPHKLAIFDEKEINHFAYDIGLAIYRAHQNNMIHRDIKLENIFYSPRSGRYKLGDFGIACITENGFADTVAFTKGYGAPEVVETLEDKYDCTADIYSFGMVLYVLLNELRFPGSKNYHPNLSEQYNRGYIPSEPINGSDALCKIVLKMLRYNPDERYQSMGEILNEIEELKYGSRLKYQREHNNKSLVFGGAFLLIGISLWKLTFAPNIAIDFTVGTYVFAILCGAQGIFHIYKKENTLLNLGVLCAGVYLLVSTGFAWWKLLLLLLVVGFDVFAGLLGGSMLIINITYLLMKYNNLNPEQFRAYRWITVLVLSLSFLMLWLYYVLEQRNEKITRTYFGKSLFWKIAILGYITLILVGMSERMSVSVYKSVLGEVRWDAFMSCNPVLVGIGGICFCTFWILREIVLEHRER